jgi:hypothetical protein
MIAGILWALAVLEILGTGIQLGAKEDGDVTKFIRFLCGVGLSVFYVFLALHWGK